MARIRSIKPEILEDEKTAPLSDAGFRLFASMIFLADDHGNVRADARWLQAQIWWAHRSPPRVAAILREVSEAQLIQVYEVRGGIYAHLLGWEKHQRIDNAGKGRVPMPNEPEAKPFVFEDDEEWQVSRRNSANLREKPLDPDPDRDPEGDRDGEPAAKAPPSKPKVHRVDSARPLPSNWEPREEEQATAIATGLRCLAEADAFRDHHTAKGSKFKDWDAAFRNWLRNAVKFSSNNRSASRETALDVALRIAGGPP